MFKNLDFQRLDSRPVAFVVHVANSHFVVALAHMSQPVPARGEQQEVASAGDIFVIDPLGLDGSWREDVPERIAR